MLSAQSTIRLNNGVTMPVCGLGVWQIPKSQTVRAVHSALETGYRLIDTASMYGNEHQVGEGIRSSGLAREEIFVTTKLSPLNFWHTAGAFHDSLGRLNLTYVDLYLVHWPAPGWGQVWRTLERLYEQKLIRAIGVSNFSDQQLESLRKQSSVVPAVNQIPISPFGFSNDTIAYCQSHGIAVEAYSPLHRGRGLNHPTVIELAKRHQKTTAQIVLRWGLQHGFIVIPKSTHRERIAENFAVFNFLLGEEEMSRLDSLHE